jgi:hypothetical protein
LLEVSLRVRLFDGGVRVQLTADKANLEQARLQDGVLRNALKSELETVRRQGEERYKALREKDKRLSDNDATIKELEKSRKCVVVTCIFRSGCCHPGLPRRLLQQQLSDLKASAEPKDVEIQVLRDQIQELADEFDQTRTSTLKKQEVKRRLRFGRAFPGSCWCC